MDNKRKVNTIKLEEFEVDVVTFLKFGEYQELEKAIVKKVKYQQGSTGGSIEFNDDVVVAPKYLLLGMCIMEIRNSAGEKQKFTEEWINDLSLDEGNKVYDVVDELAKPKKK